MINRNKDVHGGIEKKQIAHVTPLQESQVWNV